MIRCHLIPVTYRGRERIRKLMFEDDLKTAYVVFQTKSLDDDPHVPRLIKWLLRRIYHHYGWTAMGHDGKCYTKWEMMGVYDTATEARWAAMVPELPLNQSLPEETSQFRAHDFPLSSVSHEYRNRKLPFTTVPTSELERLHEATCHSNELVEYYRPKSA